MRMNANNKPMHDVLDFLLHKMSEGQALKYMNELGCKNLLQKMKDERWTIGGILANPIYVEHKEAFEDAIQYLKLGAEQ